MAVVLAGHLLENSLIGRFRVGPGEALVHGGFDCHSNSADATQPARILHVPWFDHLREGRFRIEDPDAVVRLAHQSPAQAVAYLSQHLQPKIHEADDWPAQLAEDLRADRSLLLRTWAATRGLARESVSRGFARVFGVHPRVFRLELRTREAWKAIIGSQRSLTEIAHHQCFADLSHMTRNVRRFTGLTPMGWRAVAGCRASDGCFPPLDELSRNPNATS